MIIVKLLNISTEFPFLCVMNVPEIYFLTYVDIQYSIIIISLFY